MRLSVLQSNLAKGLSIVGRAVESRPSMPVLSNVLLKTEESRLKLAAVNLSLGLGITVWIGANVEIEGAVTLPAKVFVDLVNNLSNDRVDLTLDSATQTMHLRCGGNKGNIKGIDAHEFPPLIEGGEGDLTIDGKQFKDMINQVAFSAATDDHRPALTGIFMQLHGEKITLASADGYRLAVHTGQLDRKFDKALNLLIPAKSLIEVAKVISDEDEPVYISLPNERDIILFTIGQVEISAQLLDAKFPPFESVIPKDYSTSTVMYRSDLLAACARAEIFARDSAVQRPPVCQAAQAQRGPRRSHDRRPQPGTRRQRRRPRRDGRGRTGRYFLQHQVPDRRPAHPPRRAGHPPVQGRGQSRRHPSAWP
ncbi:MAG: DNA polymerase III subunit beta [Chloroflexi bacterium]|nr:DNA polymerase III subunit beta [Chloroflexota bacterium]